MAWEGQTRSRWRCTPGLKADQSQEGAVRCSVSTCGFGAALGGAEYRGCERSADWPSPSSLLRLPQTPEAVRQEGVSCTGSSRPAVSGHRESIQEATAESDRLLSAYYISSKCPGKLGPGDGLSRERKCFFQDFLCFPWNRSYYICDCLEMGWRCQSCLLRYLYIYISLHIYICVYIYLSNIRNIMQNSVAKQF